VPVAKHCLLYLRRGGRPSVNVWGGEQNTLAFTSTTDLLHYPS